MITETELSRGKLLTAPVVMRHIAMDILYRYGGLTNSQISKLMGIGYRAVSQGRSRLRSRVKRIRKFQAA